MECVCTACFSDHGLRGFIEEMASTNTCTFCGKESDHLIAARLAEVIRYIDECLSREYGLAEDKLPYEGEYMGQVWTTRDLLESHLGDALPNDHDGALMEALCNDLSDRAWCRMHPFSLSDEEKLSLSWDALCELVKHHRRFFFIQEHPDQELYRPLTLLRELSNWCDRFDLIKPLPANHLLYRARFQKPGETLETACQLGPPPPHKASMANRMNPPGIVMFYASNDAETSLREVAKCPGDFVIGGFKTLRDLRILDLTAIPPIPSIFEPVPESLEFDPRPPLVFLSYFAADLSKPIERDRSTHIEYIPGQVVTEFLRTTFLDDGGQINGITYESARHAEGRSVVLFFSQEDLADCATTGGQSSVHQREPSIELIGRQERAVTKDDLDRWESEAPPPFEWL